MRQSISLEASPHWDHRPIKYLFTRVQRPPLDGDGIVTAFRDGQVTLRANRRAEGFTNAIQEIGYQGIRTGDLVVHAMDGFAGAIGVSDSDGKASPVVHAYRPTDGVDARFFAYLLRNLARRGFVTALAKGIRERSTAFDSVTLQSLVVPVPPPSDQRAIADYLDTETARIDALIAKKRRMAETIHERLRVFISTVTSDGRTVRVRHVTSLRTSGPRGWADLVGESGSPFIRSANLQRQSIALRTENLAAVSAPRTSEAERSRVQNGDVLIGITGANTGWVALPNADQVGGFVSQHVAVLRSSGVLPAWLAYSLFSTPAQDRLLGGQYGGTKQQLGLDDLAELSVSLPNLEQQMLGVEKLVRATLDTEAVTARLNRQIDLLVEHRQALITAAVTGELEIPGVAA